MDLPPLLISKKTFNFNLFIKDLIQIDIKHANWFGPHKDTVFNYVDVYKDDQSHVLLTLDTFDKLTDEIQSDVYNLVRRSSLFLNPINSDQESS